MSPELRQRIASGLVLGAIVLVFTCWRIESFVVLCAIATIILWREWRLLTRKRSTIFIPIGLLYIGAAIGSLLYLRHENLNILLALFAIVWVGDIAAYFAGKRFGKRKIAPHISPGKSWEGLAASILASATIAAILGHVAPVPHAILGAFFAILGLLGDMFESSLKRHVGLKDSGRIMPGHGGLLDRVDALMPCAIFAAAALYIRLQVG